MLELYVGEKFRASVSFQYKGPAKQVGVKVIVGQWTGMGGLDPIGVMNELDAWFYPDGKLVSYSLVWMNYSLVLDCIILDTSPLNSPGEIGTIYDMATELGDWPWSGHVYTRFITIDNFMLKPLVAEFRNLAVTYTKL